MEHLIRATLQPTMAQWAIEEGKTAHKAYQEAPEGPDRFHFCLIVHKKKIADLGGFFFFLSKVSRDRVALPEC